MEKAASAATNITNFLFSFGAWHYSLIGLNNTVIAKTARISIPNVSDLKVY